MTLQMFADVKGRFGGMRVNALPLYMHRKLDELSAWSGQRARIQESCGQGGETYMEK